MSRGIQGAVLKGLGARDHIATVVFKRELTPRFLRVRLTAPSLLETLAWEPSAWLRFWFPDLAGGEREFQRAYTIAAAYPQEQEIEIDMLLHEPHGPASLWVMGAKAGDTIAVMSYGSRFRMPQTQPAGFLLIGDPSSTPAINSLIAAAAPTTAIELYMEQEEAGDWPLPIAAHAQLRAHQIERGDGTALAAAIEGRDWANWFAWAAGEATTMRAVRKVLKDTHKFAPNAVHVQSYWVKGAAGRH